MKKKKKTAVNYDCLLIFLLSFLVLTLRPAAFKKIKFQQHTQLVVYKFVTLKLDRTEKKSHVYHISA